MNRNIACVLVTFSSLIIISCIPKGNQQVPQIKLTIRNTLPIDRKNVPVIISIDQFKQVAPDFSFRAFMVIEENTDPQNPRQNDEPIHAQVDDTDYDGGNYDNDGYGYARGLDLFWRDNGYSFKDVDYWISYSYLDTKRNYRDYEIETRPSYAAEHVLSLIYKQSFQIKDTRLQLSLGLTGTSGRPWYDNRQDSPTYGENIAKPYQAFNVGGSILTKVK